MPKPVKIKKAKSFMFTTKHHSFSGVMGIVLAIISFVVIIGSTYMAFINKGHLDIKICGVAFGAALLNLLGVICGLTALSERDIHKWAPITSIVANAVILFLWVTQIAHGL